MLFELTKRVIPRTFIISPNTCFQGWKILTLQQRSSDKLTIPFHKSTPFQSAQPLDDNDSGDALFFCVDWFKKNVDARPFFLTKSCTQSLELALSILELPTGSEVIIPSYGFVSLANAVVQNDLKCVFVDCDPKTMNICPDAIENAIGPSTKALITINYAGVSCDYARIIPMCRKHGLFLIEDNAHGLGSTFQNRPLGSIGDVSTFSFDRLKNITCSEGGGVAFNNPELVKKYRLRAEFGTNRSEYEQGVVSEYEWVGPGTNAQIAGPLVSILAAQLLQSEQITDRFKRHWNTYYELFSASQIINPVQLPFIPEYCSHNGYMFWIMLSDSGQRTALLQFLKQKGIDARFHYTPLHSSRYGHAVGELRGDVKNTTSGSGKLIRLPLYYSITQEEIEYVVHQIIAFLSA